MSSVTFIAASAPARAKVALARARLAAAAVTIVIIAVTLRIAGASGSLWLDEIWSLQNLENISSPGAIFWSLSRDNNHFLNSLWLWIVGPDAPPVIMRIMSIVFGCGSALMAARIVGRTAGHLGGIIAGLLFATSYAFVHYGSEARGYAGMIFGLLWAYDALVRYLDDPARDRPRLEFALAVMLGSLSQVTMLPAACALTSGALVSCALTTRSIRGACATGMRLGSALLLGATPICATLAAGILNTGAFRFGDQHPFTIASWVEGLAGLCRAVLGFPDAMPAAIVIAITVCLAVGALYIVSRVHRLLAGALLALPIVEALAGLPNLHIPRFHLVSGAALLLLFALALSRLWNDAGYRRFAASAIAALSAIGTAANTATFLQFGRGDYAEAVRIIGNDTFSTNAPPETGRVLRYFSHRVARAPVFVAAECDVIRPSWFILVDDDVQRGPTAPHLVEPYACGMRFYRVAMLPYAGLSGFRWTLYRRPAYSAAATTVRERSDRREVAYRYAVYD